MSRIFGTYRPERLLSPENYPDGITRNGTYHPATYLNAQYADWHSAGLTNCIDSLIPEERYTGEIVPGVPKLTRFLIGEYAEGVDPIAFGENVAKVGAKWNIEIFATKEETAEWVRANTDLEEPERGLFLVSPETPAMPPMTEAQPAKYIDMRHLAFVP